MDAHSLAVYVKTKDIYEDISQDFENDLIHQTMMKKTIAIGKNKKVIDLMKDLGGKKMKEFIALRCMLT